MTLNFDLLMSLICNNIIVWSYVSGQTESSLFVEVKNAKVLKNSLSLRIHLSYSDDSFGYTLSLPSQFLALSAEFWMNEFIEIYTIAEVHTVFCGYINLTNLD